MSTTVKMQHILRYCTLLFVLSACSNTAYANHDPRCNPDDGVKVCIAAENSPNVALMLRCVESGLFDILIGTRVTWLKNGQLFEPDDDRVYLQNNQLIFEELLVSDEANYKCSNGSLSPPYILYGKPRPTPTSE